MTNALYLYNEKHIHDYKEDYKVLKNYVCDHDDWILIKRSTNSDIY